MLRISLFLTFNLLVAMAFAQDVTCIFLVKTNTGLNAEYIEMMIKPANGVSTKCKTDAKGKASVVLPNNNKVIVEVGEVQVAEFTLLPKQTGIKTVSITLPAALTLATLSIGRDTLLEENEPSGTAELTLKVFDFNSRPLTDYEVFLNDEQTKRSYVARTNANGDAIFHVPPGKVYQPVIDGFDGLPKVQIRDYPGIKMTKGFAYEPTVVDEMRTGDTIVQNLKPTAKATTARVLIDVTVSDLQGQPLLNEPVFVYQSAGNLVYAAETNASGKARLLVPKGFEYYIGFKYADRIDLLNYKEKTPGEHTSVIEYSYRGSAAIEAFYSTAKRNQQGFITDFDPVSITHFKEDLSPIIKKKTYGFDLEFPEKSIIPGPLFHSAGVITSDGYWTNRIYCLNETTGQMKWGIQLAENGPSPLVESEGVLLINTESCTIYAIDVLAGNLLWSKWLSPYLYCTPTIANGKVYTVYGNDLGDGHSSNKSVLACFDLKTGSIIWQQWMPDEILGAPVYANDALYMSCWDGTLLAVDAAKGTKISSAKVNAISPPTVKGNTLLVATQAEKSSAIKRFSTTNFNAPLFVKPIGLEAKSDITKNAALSMVATYARPAIAGNTFYVADDAGLQAFDLLSGKLLWKTATEAQTNNCIAPTSAGIPTVTPNGIAFLGQSNGGVTKEFQLDKTPAGNPVFGHGMMAVPDSSGGLMLVKLTPGFVPQNFHTVWGGNAAHNLVFE